MVKHPPRLVFSELTGRIYIATRWKEHPTPGDPHLLLATTKYDVTEAAIELVAGHEMWVRKHKESEAVRRENRDLYRKADHGSDGRGFSA